MDGSLGPRGPQRKRLFWQPGQQQALLAAFIQNPYPGIAVRERLASDLGVPEPRIHTWFQNQRNRSKRQSQEGGGSPSAQEPQVPPPPVDFGPGSGRGPGGALRRLRTRITPAQTRILRQAFERNRCPAFSDREELARLTGLPEDRVQVWFQNRRARHPAQEPTVPEEQRAQIPPQPPLTRSAPGGLAPILAAGPGSPQAPLGGPLPRRSQAGSGGEQASPAGVSLNLSVPLQPPQAEQEQRAWGTLAGPDPALLRQGPGEGASGGCVARAEGEGQDVSLGAPCGASHFPTTPWEGTEPAKEPSKQAEADRGDFDWGLLDGFLCGADFQEQALALLSPEEVEEMCPASPLPPMEEEEFLALMDVLSEQLT